MVSSFEDGGHKLIAQDLGLGVYDVKGATEGVDGLGPVVDSAIPPEGDEDGGESEEDEEDSTLDSSDSNESSEEDSELDTTQAT